jgi:hypothetical protein
MENLLKFNSSFLNEQVQKGNLTLSQDGGVQVLWSEIGIKNYSRKLKDKILYQLKKEGYKFSGYVSIGYLKNKTFEDIILEKVKQATL